MAFRKRRNKMWDSQNSDAVAPSRRSVIDSFGRDPFETGSAVRILPPSSDTMVTLAEGSVLHVGAQFLAEGRAQVAEYAASASAAIRELLAGARSRRFEAVQQAKARRIMLESYRSALKQHAQAQKILGPHVRFNGLTGKNFWIVAFVIGDTAAMTLALTYGGESPVFAAIMALAVGAAVVVVGKIGEDLRRESLAKDFVESGDDETNRVVEAVFGLAERSRSLNRKVMYAFLGASLLAGSAVFIYRTVEESLGIGFAFGLWATLIGAGSFAASWYYCDPARIYISLTQQAVEEAEDIWLSTAIDAIEEHNASIEAARHIVNEHRQRAEAAWSINLAGAAAAMSTNSDIIGIAQDNGHWVLQQRMPDVYWPDLSEYYEIVDRDDVRPDSEFDAFPIFLDDVTNSMVRPSVSMNGSVADGTHK